MIRKRTKKASWVVALRSHELERAVMEQLWAAGESSVREVMDALNDPPAVERAYTTFMTIMTRLQQNGLLLRRREGKTDHYRPAHERDEYIAMQAKAEVEELITEYGDLALSSSRGRLPRLTRRAAGGSSARSARADQLGRRRARTPGRPVINSRARVRGGSPIVREPRRREARRPLARVRSPGCHDLEPRRTPGVGCHPVSGAAGTRPRS